MNTGDTRDPHPVPHPAPQAARLARAKEVFADALERPAAARATFLDEACAGDAELRAMVSALLEAHAGAARFMDSPSTAPEAAAATVAANLEGAGTRIGPYKLLEPIGEGGFGVVFMAEQTEPVVRRVALKIIKAGMDTRQVIARFEAERQALAMMDHPNIAKVLDAGATEAGRPYFVMELVRGDPITEYCDKNNLTTGDRLALFTDVCHAVQHAHQKGIIHRDIKPSNVLVTIFDGRPVPKVIDFGIAKAMNQRLTDKTLFTAHRHLIGTPQYMSPEQAEMSGVDIDTRSDIYSLGVLLYELLTGTTPFDPEQLRSAALAEVQRIIREEEPPKPSTRLSSLQTLPSVAAHRRTEPARLSAAVRGDLDWIVMKCLEKDRTRRYETANGLAADVGRHLSGEPVVAAPPSRVYRVRKFVRRNRGIATASVLVTGALLLGMTGTTLALFRAQIQRDRADASAATATRITEYIQRMLGSADPHEGAKSPDLTVRAMLDDVAANLPGELAAEPETEAVVRMTLASAYTSLARFDDAHRHLDRALEIAASTGSGKVRAAALNWRTGLLHDEGRYAEAEACAREAADLSRKHFGAGSESHVECLIWLSELAIHRDALGDAESLAREVLSLRRDDAADEDKAMARLRLSEVLHRRGDYAGAESMARDALKLQTTVLGPEHIRVSGTLHWIAVILRESGDATSAEPLARNALAMRRRILGDGHPRTAQALKTLGTILADMGEYDEAEVLLREALTIAQEQAVPDRSATRTYLLNLAAILSWKDDVAAAVPLLREALALARQDHEATAVAEAAAGLAKMLVRSNSIGEAESLAREALSLQRSAHGDEHAMVASSLRTLSTVLKFKGDLASAEAAGRQALEMYRKLVGPIDARTRGCLDDLSGILQAQGRYGEAAVLLQESISAARAAQGEDDPQIARTLTVLAITMRNAGKNEMAESYLMEALDLRTRIYGESHPDVATSLYNLGSQLVSQGDFAEAEPHLRRAIDIRRREFGPDHATIAMTQIKLALVIDRLGNPDDALKLLRDCMDMQRRLLPEDSAELAREAGTIGLAMLKMESRAAAEAAEPILRQLLDFRQTEYPDGDPQVWMRFSAMSLLGESLSRQGRFAEAEPLLVEGSNGLVTSPNVPAPVPLADHRREALVRVIECYEAFDHAEPGKGYDAKAANWRTRLEEYDRTRAPER